MKKRIKRVKMSSYKILAKSIINENVGRCAVSFLLIYGARIFLVLTSFGLFFAAYEKFVPVYAAAITAAVLTGLTFLADSFFVALGELFLSALSSCYCGEDEFCVKTYAELSAHLRKIGFINLIRIRIKMLVGIVRDTTVSLIPAIVVMFSVIAFTGASAVPTEAFFVSLSGIILTIFTVREEIILEYDKYRFVYSETCLIFEKNEKLLDTQASADRSFVSENAVKQSCELYRGISDEIKRCENSFIPRKIFSIVTLPLLLPLLYLSIYKKVTMYCILERRENDFSKNQDEFCGEETIIFNIPAASVYERDAY